LTDAKILIVEQPHPSQQIIEDMRATIVRTHAITRHEENGSLVVDALQDFADRSVQRHVDFAQRMRQRPRSLLGVREVRWVVEMPKIMSRRMRLAKDH